MSRLIIAIILLVITAAIAVFVIRPQWDKITALRQSLRELGAFNDELNRLAVRRDELTNEYNQISEADLVKLSLIAPADRRAASVLIDLETLALKSGVAIDQVDFLAGEKTSTQGLTLPSSQLFGAIPVTLNLRGSYETFRGFLTALERNLRLIDVDEIAITSSQGKEAPITLKGTIYYRK